MSDIDLYLDEFKRELEELDSDGNRIRNNLNVNMDMDGCFSAAIMLLAYPDFKICGYNDSCTRYYSEKNLKRKSVVNLDFFCKSRGVMCIDNHINSIVAESYPLKYNPNFVRGVPLDRYTEKYPFSTFLFLCAVFDHFNMLPDIDIEAEIEGDMMYRGSKIRLWQLMLRADSVLYNTMHYYENAMDWWKWLIRISGKDGITYKLCRKVMRFKELCDANGLDCKEESENENNYISGVFMTKYGTREKDGFNSLSNGLFSFIRDIFGLFGVTAEFPSMNELVLYTYRRILYESDDTSFFKGLINDDRVLSYAFVRWNTISLNIREQYYDDFRNNDKMKLWFSSTDDPVEVSDFNIPIIM